MSQNYKQIWRFQNQILEQKIIFKYGRAKNIVKYQRAKKQIYKIIQFPKNLSCKSEVILKIGN